ncbi:hypothetical protein [Brachybacterium vulturis]|uniref:hypothetical protein n=1 Tax=Brachybacterium vulturis TaxID=2017484 RepID=UPI0012FD79D2|nr:hypothetical protein [Brachybacterium vulturis]
MKSLEEWLLIKAARSSGPLSNLSDENSSGINRDIFMTVKDWQEVSCHSLWLPAHRAPVGPFPREGNLRQHPSSALEEGETRASC